MLVSLGLGQQAKDLRAPLMKASCQVRAAGGCGSRINQPAEKPFIFELGSKTGCMSTEAHMAPSKSVCSDFKGMIAYDAPKKDQAIKNYSNFCFLNKIIPVSSNISESTPGRCEATECRHLTGLRKGREKGKQSSRVLNPCR